jgi:predicted transcriptional regulator
MATTLRLPDDIDARLTDLSTVTGKSRNQLIIEILSETFDREDAAAEADRIFDKLLARDARLLERLADA